MRDQHKQRFRDVKAQVVTETITATSLGSSTETGHGGPEPTKKDGLCPLGSGEPSKGFEKGSNLHFKKRWAESEPVSWQLERCWPQTLRV